MLTGASGAPACQRGIALLEALVAMLLFCVGIVGIVGLQARMTQAQAAAKARAEAAFLAHELVGRMWSDRSNLAAYATAPAAPCTHPPCATWLAKVQATLPRAEATVTVSPASGRVVLTLGWTPPGEETHRHALATTLR